MPITLAILLAATTGLPDLVNARPPWAQFSRAPGIRRETTKVEVGTLGYDEDAKHLDYWLRRTFTKGGVTTITWTTSRTCGSVRSVIASMRDVPSPKLAPPGYAAGAPVVLDGIDYTLRAPSEDGTLTTETNVETPLAQWVEASLKTLSACWTLKAPDTIR
jgi:hypothetical protein